MTFHFPSLFRPKPSLEEYAAMRDRALVAETKAVLLENIVEHANRPRREVLKDAGRYREESAKRKAELIAYAARLSNPVREEA
jgi:hypothetical protein